MSQRVAFGGLRRAIDPTLGEVSEEERRRLVRQIADTVGKRVARKAQDAAQRWLAAMPWDMGAPGWGAGMVLHRARLRL